jgi:hypothetical protein
MEYLTCTGRYLSQALTILGDRKLINLKNLIAELQQKRDDIKLQLHLGTMEAEEEWDTLVAEWDKFLSTSQFDQTAEEVGDAARELGLKMKVAYDKARKTVE